MSKVKFMFVNESILHNQSIRPWKSLREIQGRCFFSNHREDVHLLSNLYHKKILHILKVLRNTLALFKNIFEKKFNSLWRGMCSLGSQKHEWWIFPKNSMVNERDRIRDMELVRACAHVYPWKLDERGKVFRQSCIITRKVLAREIESVETSTFLTYQTTWFALFLLSKIRLFW